MTSLRRLIGMPVVCGDELVGYVERGVLSEQARRLKGLVVRRGLGGAKWIPSRMIDTLGSRCVIATGDATRMPKVAQTSFSQAFLTTGQRLGTMTDALISPETFAVVALEVGGGPLFGLMGKRRYLTRYSVRPESGHCVGTPTSYEIVAAEALDREALERRRKEGKR